MNAFYSHVKCGDPKKLADQSAFFDKEFLSLGDDCAVYKGKGQHACYRLCISSCAQMIYLRHFGFRGTLLAQQVIEKGIAFAATYFRLVGGPSETITSGIDERDEIAWYSPYAQALLLATLAGNKRERASLSDYLHPNLVVETVAIRIEPALGDVLLCIAKSFQASPMDTAVPEKRLQKSRKTRPKLLFSAWQALNREDKARFVGALTDSTENFAKTAAEDDLPLTAIAVPESILAALAYERGWTDLSFDLPIAARLVTHQSLGLA